ncbi:hypothetical protein [Stenotrophomonas sp. Iso1]|uniref:hypothetical protein n=1 Tax=Stenotrophomonas sp. Iso1 TaxID=2977283 RepID=UPI0022B7A37F|nr:hypothetical protein [Stenotrophomonas sp. Iso1]
MQKLSRVKCLVDGLCEWVLSPHSLRAGQAIHCGVGLAVREDSFRELKCYVLGKVIAKRLSADLMLGTEAL